MKKKDASIRPVQLQSEPQAQPGQAMTRRRFVKVAVGAVLGGVAGTALTACTQAPSSSSASTPGTVSPPSATQTSMPGMAMPTTSPPNATHTGVHGMTMPTTPAPASTAAANSPTSAPAATAPAAPTTAAAVGGTLFIPPLLVPQVQNGTKVFHLTLQQGQSQFLAGTTTTTFGINGNYLGPTLRASQGEKVLIHVTNHLGENTTLHWHGMHVPPTMDGGPHQVISDHSTWSPQFTIQQPAATLWYHPHMMGQTLRQVSMGLVGMFILDDTNPVQQSLPHTYGVDDIPLIFQDQRFGTNGEFIFDGGGRGGNGGQATTLVNGTIAPTITTSQSRLRLRLLNASNERFYTFGFASDETFHQVASDGGLLPAPVPMTRLRLAPAERAEIIIDVPASRPMVLQNFGGRGGNNAQTGALLTISATGPAQTLTALPTRLNAIERLQADAAIQTRDMVLDGNDRNPTINDQSMTAMAHMMDMANIMTVKLGTTEIWNLIDRSGDNHAIHVHDVQFQILDRNGAPPAANEAGLKDTVMVGSGETVRIIMRFTDFADPHTPYMFHCHVLEHEDNGMMGQFVVVSD